jgi:small-conductance mechanosensitive channel
LPWTAPLPVINLSLVQIFLLIALLVGVFWFSSGTKRFLFNRLLAQSGLDRSLQYAIAQVISNIVLVVGIFFVLENAGIHLAALAVFAGAVGDRVEVAGILDTVRQIRARSTVIVTNDNIAIIVPNSKFIDSPVTNWHYGDTSVRFRLPVGVAYGSDVNKVQEALIAAARQHSGTLKNPEPTAFLERFGNSTIDFELVAWTREMSHSPRRFRSDLNYLIYNHLTAAGIEIPNPQRDLHIRSGTLKVENVTKENQRT